MVEGDAVTEMRTAAASAVATMELHPVLGNSKIGLFFLIMQTLIVEYYLIIINFMFSSDRK